MAVLLCREGERKSQAALPPEDRSLPRVTVRNQPVSAAPHWSGRLRARTPEHIAYAQPEREQVWREKFERLGILGIGGGERCLLHVYCWRYLLLGNRLWVGLG